MNTNESLSPYANDQPEQLPMNSIKICRIPLLATPQGINPEFQLFYDEIVDAITSKNLDFNKLYQLSDKALTLEQFESKLSNYWSRHFENFYGSDAMTARLDIELNMDRFKEPYRNLVGGFNILTCHLNVIDDEFEEQAKFTELVQACTELLFTYSDTRGFILISKFTGFKYDM